MKRELILTTILIGVLCICTVPAKAQTPGQRSNSIVFVDGNDFYLHTVSQGETLYGIGRLYNISPERIKQDNPGLDDNTIKEGQILKILCGDIPENKMSARKQARTFSEHTVAAGDTTYSIAKRYGISVETIIEDNPGLDPAVLSVGTVLRIRKSEIGAADDSAIASEISRYAEALNEVSDDYLFYVVRQGDTLYSLSHTFNVAQDTLARVNNLTDGLKAGAILKIPYSGEGRDVTAAITNGGQPSDGEDFRDTAYGNFTDIADCEASHYYGLTDFEYRGNMNVSVLLPFSDTNDAGNRNFVDFYRGILLALEDLKSAGYSMTVNVYNTQRDIGSLNEIIQSHEFRSSDLIIGPVYEAGLESVMNVARQMRVPLVSPLAVIEGDYGSSLYQMAPDPAHKYDKLKALFTRDKNIIFVTSPNTDDEFARDMAALAEGYEVNRVNFTANRDQALLDFRRALSTANTNMFVVLSDDPVEIDKILATISSINTNYQARSQKIAPIEVIGSSKWARYNNIDRELYFKLNVTYITNYAVHRSNINVNQFDRRYLTEYSNLPSPYAYRGYDTVMLFAEGMIQKSDMSLNDKLDSLAPPLQAGYKFETKNNGNNVNIDWPLVRYKDDFTVEIK